MLTSAAVQSQAILDLTLKQAVAERARASPPRHRIDDDLHALPVFQKLPRSTRSAPRTPGRASRNLVRYGLLSPMSRHREYEL